MRGKTMPNGFVSLLRFALFMAFAVVGWRIFRETWPSPSVLLGGPAGFLVGQGTAWLAYRVARHRRGAARAAGQRQGVAVRAAWRPGPGQARGSFDVVLRDVGRKKIQVIKTIMENTGFSLKESKDLVDLAPSVVFAGLPEDVASEAAAILTAVGAEVIVRYSPPPEDGSADVPA